MLHMFWAHNSRAQSYVSSVDHFKCEAVESVLFVAVRSQIEWDEECEQ